MIKKLDAFLFGNIPFSCESNFSLEDSVSRLQENKKQQENKKRYIFGFLSKEKIIGKVGASRVVLARVVPFFPSGFNPTLVGKFKEENGRVYFEGKFTTFWFPKIFMTIWLSFSLLWIGLAFIPLFQTLADQANKLSYEVFILPIFGIAFSCIGVLILKLSWRLSIKDIDYLKKIVIEALTK